MEFLDIGFQSLISKEKIVSVLTPESAPVKRIVKEAKEEKRLIDASYGRKTSAVIVMDSGHVILSGQDYDTLLKRLGAEEI